MPEEKQEQLFELLADPEFKDALVNDQIAPTVYCIFATYYLIIGIWLLRFPLH
jgi:hypothetical protein